MNNYTIFTPYYNTLNQSITFDVQEEDYGVYILTDNGQTLQSVNMVSYLRNDMFKEKFINILHSHQVKCVNGTLLLTSTFEKFGEKIKEFAIVIKEIDKMIQEKR